MGEVQPKEDQPMVKDNQISRLQLNNKAPHHNPVNPHHNPVNPHHNPVNPDHNPVAVLNHQAVLSKLQVNQGVPETIQKE